VAGCRERARHGEEDRQQQREAGAGELDDQRDGRERCSHVRGEECAGGDDGERGTVRSRPDERPAGGRRRAQGRADRDRGCSVPPIAPEPSETAVATYFMTASAISSSAGWAWSKPAVARADRCRGRGEERAENADRGERHGQDDQLPPGGPPPRQAGGDGRSSSPSSP
jgi:hypothetical protein